MLMTVQLQILLEKAAFAYIICNRIFGLNIFLKYIFKPMPIRLDSFLSKNGISSRRKAKELISQEKVTVNGEVVLEVLQVDPEKDEISVENQLVNPKYLKKRYIAFYKPLNVLSSTKDEWGRKTVLEHVKVSERVFPVGRLDYNSTGLI
ncbi:MAG TPA: rRNA pseudouridine synthase, partial [candidate division WWE3 bacterium]|nr:rRNA pseudouridine synthase [candidate division WWE3 bacterium]